MKKILIKRTAENSKLLLHCLPAFVCGVDECYIKYFMNDGIFQHIKARSADENNPFTIILDAIQEVTDINKLKETLASLEDRKVYAVSYSEKLNPAIEELFEVKTLEEIVNEK